MNDIHPDASKKNTRNILLAILVVILLAVAVFVGGRLLRQQKTAAEKGDFKVVAAAGLPKAQFDLLGSVISREGNSLFIQTKGMNESLGIIGGKGVEANTDNAPPTEVVISQNTQFFRDSTWDAVLSGEADKKAILSEGQIKQKIAPGSADEIDTGSSVTVWGQRTGDRIVAEFILYSLPLPNYGDKKIIK